MYFLSSRWLSLAATGVAAFHVLRISAGSWYVLLIVVPSLILIWWPDMVDDLTFGTWHDGNRIDTHTPPVMIAGFGWILLAVEVFILLKVRMIDGRLGI